jgi:hypothetical protein
MPDYPITAFPSNTVTDGNYLFRSLGSFWTTMFQERESIKGYTLGQAEEMVQRYYDLIETISSYSVEQVPVFSRTKWLPLIIYKSEFNRIPFIFEEGEAVFGNQPADDVYYNDTIFQFGTHKTPIAEIFAYALDNGLKQVSIIADKVIAPEVVFTSGVDIKIDDSILYFNTNIFENSKISKAKVIGENGVPETFVDTQGNTVEEEFVVLWCYHAEQDESNLFYNFGYIFDLNLSNDEFYKTILNALFNLYIDGPTINNVKHCCAAFMGVPMILKPSEVVENIFEDSQHRFIVTDQSCYKAPVDLELSPIVVVGTTLFAGDILVRNIEYYDNVIANSLIFYSGEQSSRGWWLTEGLIDDKLAFSKYLFDGEYTQQLLFSTTLDIVTLDEDGSIVFPVEGQEKDIATFNAYLNDPVRKDTIKELLELEDPGDSYPIVPLTFMMENFFKSNSAMLKFVFSDSELQTKFLNLLPIIKLQLPPYVYLILKIDLSISNETYENLNDSNTIVFDSGEEIVSADGSNETGEIENLAPYGYRDVEGRLFAISLLVKKSPTEDLPYDYVGTDPDDVDPSVVSEGRFLQIKEGKPLRAIPEGATTAQYSNLQLIDFTD